jgi:signal peptidase II
MRILRQGDRKGTPAGVPQGDPVRGVQTAGGAPLTPPAPGPAPARPRVRLLLGVAAFVITADAISKAIAVAHIREYSEIHLIGNLLMLTLTRNGGAAFNLGGTGMTIVFTAIAASVIAYILRAARNLRSTAWAIALGLLLGGASGNLIDRIFRAPGFLRGDVIDWIQLPHWPVFNVADSSIVCAGVLVVLLSMRGIRLDGTRVPHAPASPEPSSPEPSSPGLNPPGLKPRGPNPPALNPRGPNPPALNPPNAPNPPNPDYPEPNYPEPDHLTPAGPRADFLEPDDKP